MRHCQRFLLVAFLIFTLLLRDKASAQFVQQGSKLAGIGATVRASQGTSVALSADGNTAIIGGWGDSVNVGAAWVFTRSGIVWSQQGNKLVGTGAVGYANQGCSVALSADGNTAVVGGFSDSSLTGAAWIFTRSSVGLWTQQGNKLVGTGSAGMSGQGWSVALSADGNTAAIGGSSDSGQTGAAWIFIRVGGLWGQQGGKLVGTGSVGSSGQGQSVALSADGNILIVGGHVDSNHTGAAWVFTRNGNVWSQQGSKLVGTGAVGNAFQGYSVSLSADGNTAIVGGHNDNNRIGAVWVFTRNTGVWSQQGSKLTGIDNTGKSVFGCSVSLSADGNTALVGGYGDSLSVGASWVFARIGSVWTQQGSKLVGSDASIGIDTRVGASQGVSVSLSADGNTAMVGGPGDSTYAGAVWVFVRSQTTVRGPIMEVPQRFDLAQNYPNPFNPNTTIRYELPISSDVRLYVFDVLGREVCVLANKRMSAGVHEVRFEGSELPSGTYFYRLQTENFNQTKKLLIVK